MLHGDDGLASEWTRMAHECVHSAFQATVEGPKGGFLPMRNTFEVLCFTFCVGRVGGRRAAQGGGGGDDNRPWLVQVIRLSMSSGSEPQETFAVAETRNSPPVKSAARNSKLKP